MKYKFITETSEKAYYLNELKPLIDKGSNIDYYVEESCLAVKRKTFDGCFTMIIKIHGKAVGVCYNDYRGFGSTFGITNSLRIGRFLDHLTESNIPLVYFANSAGIRIHDSRAVYENSFSLIAKIKKFAKNNLYISACLGSCLGISALLYSVADYRLALKDVCSFNLTGPEIFRMFFGDSVDFSEACSAEVMKQENDLVQEICVDKNNMFMKIRSILNVDECVTTESLTHDNLQSSETLELLPGNSKSVKLLIKNTLKGRVGLFLNPIGKPNMIGVKDIEQYRAGLKIFKKLGLPILNLVDVAGGDPRIAENNNNIARAIYDLACDIIDYPYYKRSIIVGRCFGGMSILMIPVFYGGKISLMTHESKVGIMDNNIIKHLLMNAKPLLDAWEKSKESEGSNYEDYVEAGLVLPRQSLDRALQIAIEDMK